MCQGFGCGRVVYLRLHRVLDMCKYGSIIPKYVSICLNPFVPNAPFFYPLKTSESRKVC